MSRRCPAAPDLCARVTCLASSLRNRDGHIPTLDECDRMTDAELIERLISIKGIGRWTAEMLLIFNLGRPDVLPVDDLGVRKGFQFAYGKRKLPEPEQLARYGLRWSPYRTAAAWYLWRAAAVLDGDRKSTRLNSSHAH